MTNTNINEHSLAQALDPENPYFITTHLYWDCECDREYIRPASMLMCEDCGALKDESPDSRLNEVRSAGIHIPWTEPQFAQTLEEHNTNRSPIIHIPDQFRKNRE